MLTVWDFYRWRLHLLMTKILLLVTSRPPKQVNLSLSFPCRLLVSLNQMKVDPCAMKPRSEHIQSSRRIDSNLHIRRSKTALKEPSMDDRRWFCRSNNFKYLPCGWQQLLHRNPWSLDIDSRSSLPQVLLMTMDGMDLFRQQYNNIA